jgi:hypothetical protein
VRLVTQTLRDQVLVVAEPGSTQDIGSHDTQRPQRQFLPSGQSAGSGSHYRRRDRLPRDRRRLMIVSSQPQRQAFRADQDVVSNTCIRADSVS